MQGGNSLKLGINHTLVRFAAVILDDLPSFSQMCSIPDLPELLSFASPYIFFDRVHMQYLSTLIIR